MAPPPGLISRDIVQGNDLYSCWVIIPFRHGGPHCSVSGCPQALGPINDFIAVLLTHFRKGRFSPGFFDPPEALFDFPCDGAPISAIYQILSDEF